MRRYSTARKQTARAQRKDDATAVGVPGPARLSTGRRRRGTARSELAIVPAEVIPEQPTPERPASAAAERRYLAREHVRRDIGSRIVLLDLEAPDVPPDAPDSFRDPGGVLMRYLVRCVSHGDRKYFGSYGAACRAVKASHLWCPDCKAGLARRHRLHT